MLGHFIGFGGSSDGGLQLPITSVLETENGDVDHEAMIDTKGVIKLHLFTDRSLHKAKPGVPHVREGGT